MFLKVFSFNIFLCLLVLKYISIIQSLKVIPSRSNVTYYDSKYLRNPIAYISRYGRNSPYFLNIDVWFLYEWNNNVTISLTFNEYLNQQYRRSFIEITDKFCNFVNRDQYIGLGLQRAGLRCPAPAGHYKMLNISFPTANFPNVFPLKKARVDVNLLRTDDKGLLASGFVDATFINPGKIKTKP